MRKVIFKLEEFDGYRPGLSPEEQKEKEEREKERDGIFHCWAPCLVHDPKTDQIVPSVCAIIEDVDGELHEVPVRRVRFYEPLLRQK